MSGSLLSIITPAYNRANLLERCFASLKAQRNANFEWIIVDDGSTDNTKALIASFSAAAFPIVYVQKENGGKHTALNASHPYIHGQYVLILDSDDYLVEDAVEQVLTAWRQWDGRKEVGMVVFLKGITVNDPNCIVETWNAPVDFIRCKRTCIHSNDCCEVIRTELFRKFPFPVFSGERFLGEGALWYRVSLESSCVYYNSVIYICAYLEDGLTQAGRAMRIRNPHGGMFNANLYMRRTSAWLVRVRNGLLYTCYGFFANLSPIQMTSACDNRFLMWCCLPFGWCLYHWWKKKYSQGGRNG